MGSFIEINDTLQVTKKQGFPAELNLEKHLQKPFKAENFNNKIFSFNDKPDIRCYQQFPTRNFFVENRNGKWIYWGLIQILEVTCDYVKKTTSGKYKIIYINTPEEMKKAHDIMDRRSKTRFFE